MGRSRVWPAPKRRARPDTAAELSEVIASESQGQLNLAARQGRALISSLRGAPVDGDEVERDHARRYPDGCALRCAACRERIAAREAGEAHARTVAALDPSARDVEPEPEREAEVTNATIAALAPMMGAAMTAVGEASGTVLGALDGDGERGVMLDAWRGAERAIGLALACIASLASIHEWPRVHDGDPDARRRGAVRAGLDAERRALVVSRWTLRAAVGAACLHRGWVEPDGLNRLPHSR